MINQIKKFDKTTALKFPTRVGVSSMKELETFKKREVPVLSDSAKKIFSAIETHSEFASFSFDKKYFGS